MTDVEDPGIVRRDFLRRAALTGTAFALVPAVDAAAARAASKDASAAAAPKVIGVSLPFRGADVYGPLMAGAAAEAKELGYTILESDVELAAAPQLAELDTWLAKGVAGLTIYPVDLNSLGPLVSKARSQGVVVCAYGAPVPNTQGSVLFNETQGRELIGQACGHWLKKNVKGAPQVALLTQPGQEASVQRINGAVAAMKKIVPNAKVVAQAAAAAAPDALTAAGTIFAAHPDVNAFICINDQDLTGIQGAMARIKKPVKSVWAGGFDGSKEAMQLILSGKITGATAALQLVDIGRATVSVPVSIIKKKPGNKHVVANYVLVDNSTPALARKLIKDYG